MMDWRPIESAPWDRTIMLWPHCCPATWDMGAENWLVMDIPLDEERRIDLPREPGVPKMWFELMADCYGVKPTHWAEMPDGPGCRETPTEGLPTWREVRGILRDCPSPLTENEDA